MRPRFPYAVAAVLASVFAAQAALAYVLPADYIVHMLAEKRERMNIQDMSIQLTLERHGHDAPIEERLYLKDPERLRRVRQEEDATTVSVVREGATARGPEGALERRRGKTSELLPLLLMPAGGGEDARQSRILSALRGLGIDTMVVALGRFDGRVAYIIGAHAYEPEKPQLWIDKETFLPLRLVIDDESDGGKVRVETRWLEFGSSVTGDWFPRVIEVYRDGERVERAEVQKIELNKKVPETLFALP